MSKEIKQTDDQGLADTLLVSIDFSHGDKDILLVGRRTPETGLEVINWFQDDEARELYHKLIGEGKE